MKKITLLLALILLLSVGVTACAKSREYPQPPAYYGTAGGAFPIVASYAFYPPFITEQQFRWVKEAGFNVLRKKLGTADIDSCLALARKTGIYIMVAPWDMQAPDNIRQTEARYKEQSNVWGYDVADEPPMALFGRLKEAMALIDSLSPNLNGYINLHPDDNMKALGASDYREYVEEFVATVNPPFLSFDAYPVMVKDGVQYVNDIFFRSISVIADVAKASGRPFWSYVMCDKHLFYPRPTKASISFPVFASLAYGAQGLNYYTYLHPDHDKGKNQYSYAPIGLDGKRSATWYIVRDVNREVLNLQDVFLGAEVDEVGVTGPRTPQGARRIGALPSPWGMIESYGEGVIVSRLHNGTDRYLLIVNRDINRKQKVRLSRTGSVTRIYGDGTRRQDITPLFTLEPGGWALFKY